MVQQIFTLVPRLNPSLGFVTAQEIQNTTNNKKKQRWNLDSGAFRPRVIREINKTIVITIVCQEAPAKPQALCWQGLLLSYDFQRSNTTENASKMD